MDFTASRKQVTSNMCLILEATLLTTHKGPSWPNLKTWIYEIFQGFPSTFRQHFVKFLILGNSELTHQNVLNSIFKNNYILSFSCCLWEMCAQKHSLNHPTLKQGGCENYLLFLLVVQVSICITLIQIRTEFRDISDRLEKLSSEVTALLTLSASQQTPRVWSTSVLASCTQQGSWQGLQH